MRIASLALVLLALASSPRAQLAGTYSVYGVGADYVDLGAAVADLNAVGVSGAVTFEIASGTYGVSGLPTITAFSGASAANRVTFTSATGTAADVTLQTNPTGTADNGALALDGADYVTVQNLTFEALSSTYSRLVTLTGEATGVEIRDNVFVGTASQTTAGSTTLAALYATNLSGDGLTVDGNTITGFSYGMRLDGSLSSRPTGIEITNNTVTVGRTAARVGSADGTLVEDNVLVGSQYGVYLLSTGVDGTQAARVARNRASGNAYPIWLSNVDGASGSEVEVVNNVATGSAQDALYVTGSDEVRVWHNTAVGAGSGRAFTLNSGAGVDVRNNVFVTESGDAARITPGSGFTSDHNLYYTTGAYVGRVGSTSYIDLASFSAALSAAAGTATGANSVFADPAFTDAGAGDFTPRSHFAREQGDALGVPTDIDGTARPTPAATDPDLGAIEAGAPDPTFAPLAGTYAIPAAFATLGEATEALALRGASAAVTFSISPGSYAGQAVIAPWGGASAADRLTVTSATSTAADVTLSYAATSTSDNYVLALDGARHVTLQNLTLDAGSGSYTTAIQLGGAPHDVAIINNVITSAPINSSSSTRALIRTNGSLPEMDAVTISDNTFAGGGWAVRLDASSSTRATNLSFTGNTVDAGYGGFRLSQTVGPLIRNNDITGGTYGVYLSGGIADDALVAQNRAAGGFYGIYVQSLDAVSGSEAELSNNVALGNTQAINVTGSDHWRIWYNTAVLTDNAGQALFVNGGAGLDVRGNVLWANGGEAYGSGSTAPTSFTSDYNALYTTGAIVGRVGGTEYADLGAFSAALGAQTGTTTGANSVFADPIFPDPLAGDVTPGAPALDATSAPVLVAEDLDGADRSTLTPTDLGAVAFTTPLTPLAAGVYSIPGDFATLADALDALRAGIAGAVTFEFAAGTYAERGTLLPVTGASATNRVTFASASGSAADVTLAPAAATSTDDNHILRIEGARHVTLRDLTFAPQASATYLRAVALSGGPQDIEILDAAFSAASSTASSTSAALIGNDGSLEKASDVTISGSTFTGGAYGVRLTSTSTADDRLTDLVVESNTITTGRTGLRLDQAAGPVVRLNDITTSFNYGIYLNGGDADGALVSRNRVRAGNRGIDVNSMDATSGSEAELSNNLVEVDNVGLAFSSSDYWRVWNNTAVTSATAAAALSISTGTGLDVRANVLVADAGRAYDATGSLTSFTSDYNALYATGTDVGRVSGTGHPDLASFAAALGTLAGTATSANTVFADPAFVDAANGDFTPAAPLLDATSAPALVSLDFVGADRSALTPTDLGAIAFTTAVTPLAGIYSVGTSGDYASLGEAVAALGAGVSAPVTFELADETFTDRVVITPVTGASATNTVTITAASGATPVLTPPEAAGPAENYVVRLDGADHVTISGLTFEPAGTTYERAVVLAGALDGVTISDNTVTADGTSGGTGTGRAAFVSDGPIEGDGLVIDGNTAASVGQGVDLRGASSNRPTNVVISGNTVTAAGNGLDLRTLEAPAVVDNEVVSGRFALNIQGVTGASRVERNRVDAGLFGIQIINSDAASGSEARLANNMVSTSFSSNQALALVNSDGWRVWHNTAVVASGSAGAVAFRLFGSARADVQNNLFGALTPNGVPYSVDSPTLADFVSGSNALLSNGPTVGRVDGTAYETVADFVAALDAVDPTGTEGTGTFRLDAGYFVDAATADLHTRAGALDGAGVDLGLAVDIDGESRPRPAATAPDIGADEVNLSEVACATVAAGAWTPTNAALWDCGYVPGTTTEAVVAHAVTVADGATAGYLTVSAAGTATLDADATLSVYDRLTPTGTIDAANGELRLEGDADGPAVLDAGYAGTFTQEWPVSGVEGWRQIGPSVQGVQLSDLNSEFHTQGAPWATFSNGTPLLYSWEASSQSYLVAGESGDGPFEPGTGHFFYVFDEAAGTRYFPGTAAFTGTEADLSTPLVTSWSDDGSGAAPYAMIANPVAGVIDWDEVYANAGTANVGANIWSYRPGPSAGYATYNAVSGVENGISQAIQPFQAVWVQGDGTVGTATVTVEADDRDNALTPEVYDRRAAPQTLRLRLAGEALSAPDAIAVFDARAADGPDVLDAEWLAPMGSAWVAAYFVDGDRALVFDARPEADRALGLAVETTVAGTYTLSWPDLSSFPEDLPLTLLDRETGEAVDLRATPDYSFDLAASAQGRQMAGPASAARTAADEEPRFEMVVGAGATSREGEAVSEFALAAPYPNPTARGATVAFEVPEAGEVTVELVDLLGRRVAVLAEGPHAVGRHQVEIEPGALAAGAYLVRMRAGSFVASERVTVVR